MECIGRNRVATESDSLVTMYSYLADWFPNWLFGNKYFEELKLMVTNELAKRAIYTSLLLDNPMKDTRIKVMKNEERIIDLLLCFFFANILLWLLAMYTPEWANV